MEKAKLLLLAASCLLMAGCPPYDEFIDAFDIAMYNNKLGIVRMKGCDPWSKLQITLCGQSDTDVMIPYLKYNPVTKLSEMRTIILPREKKYLEAKAIIDKLFISRQQPPIAVMPEGASDPKQPDFTVSDNF